MTGVAAFSPAEERRWVDQMVAKLQTREERRRRNLVIGLVLGAFALLFYGITIGRIAG